MVPLFHVALLVLFVILIYAIIGLELYSGMLNNPCYNNITNKFVKNAQPCGQGRQCMEDFACLDGWIGPNEGVTGFNNILQAMLTVFQCITLEGWTDVLYWAQDATGRFFPPLFFCSLVFLGGFFVVNLVLGTLCGEFSRERERAKRCGTSWNILHKSQNCEDDNGETAEQFENSHFVWNMHECREGQQDERKGVQIGWRENFFRAIKTAKQWCLRAVKTQAMFWIVLLLVFLNSCILATEHYGQPVWLTSFQVISHLVPTFFFFEFLQNVANIVFVILFTLELLLKIFALGPGLYFQSLFNRFDLFVVVTSLMEVLQKYPKMLKDSIGCQGDFDKIGSSTTTWALSSSLCSPSQSVQGDKVSYLKCSRLQRWSFFSNDAMVMFFLQGTIANDGFSMVLLPPDHHH